MRKDAYQSEQWRKKRSAVIVAATLVECEQVIERGLATFVEVGEALLRIRDERLYRETHATFEDYCRERWDFSRQRGQQLIEAAQVTTTVVTADLPAPNSERVARELPREPEQARETWAKVVDLHGEKPTAAQVREVVSPSVAPSTSPASLDDAVKVDVTTQAAKLIALGSHISVLLADGGYMERIDRERAERMDRDLETAVIEVAQQLQTMLREHKRVRRVV